MNLNRKRRLRAYWVADTTATPYRLLERFPIGYTYDGLDPHTAADGVVAELEYRNEYHTYEIMEEWR